MRLASWLPARYVFYLRCLSHLLDRLGHDCALAAWQEVYQDYDDGLLLQILTTGWSDDAQAGSVDAEGAIASSLAGLFPSAREGVSRERARRLVEMMPPIGQIRRTFASLNVRRETTAYEALHLLFDGPAILTDALIRSHGKQGELIAYDMFRDGRLKAAGGRTGSVAECMAHLTRQPEEANIYTAGLRQEIVHASAHEVVFHIRECEWARYFRERHPQVGYLVACSGDEAVYRAFNEDVRMQRTATLMEGGKVCDFRIYAVGEAFDAP